MPKHRGNLFHVIRILSNENTLEDMQVVGSYETLERADEVKAAYEQGVVDGILPSGFSFEVQIGTYYDE